MSVKHKFSSIIPDGLDPALVKPSNWNDDHIADFNGIAKSVSGSLTQAIADTDYLTPTGSGAFLTGITAAKVGLGNVTNESKTTMFTSPAFTGVPTGPTAVTNTNTTQLSTCEFVLGQASNTNPAIPLDSAVVGTSTMFARGDHSHPANFTTNATDIQMNGTQALGSSTKYARADHVHPSDTARAPLASPTFTGTVTAPSFTSTAATGTAPFTVASNTMVSNLNAQYIGGTALTYLVDTLSAQTITGNKNFTGSTTLSGINAVHTLNGAASQIDTRTIGAITLYSSSTGTDSVLTLNGDNGATLTAPLIALNGETGIGAPPAAGKGVLQVTGGTKTDTLKVNSSTLQPLCSADFGVGIGVTDATFPIVQIKNTSAPVDKKYFRLGASIAGDFAIGRVNDAYSTETLFLRYDAGDNLYLSPAGLNALVVPYIASATNYHQFNSSAGGTPVYYAQGSASDVNLGLTSKGNGNIFFCTNNFTTAQFQVSNTTSAVNRLAAVGAATAGLPQLYATGTDTNIGFTLLSKGTYGFGFWTGGGQQFSIGTTASAVNYLSTYGGVAGAGISLSAVGADTNIQNYINAKGSYPTSFTGAGVAEQFRVASVASAVNYMQVQGNQAGHWPMLTMQGVDTNINVGVYSKGTGNLGFYAGGAVQFAIGHVDPAVNFMQVQGAVASGYTTQSNAGTSTDIGHAYITKGAGPHSFSTGGGQPQFAIGHVASTVNFLSVWGSTTGSTPAVAAAGSDANIDIALTPKGTGRVKGTMLSFACERVVLPTVGQTFAFGNGNSVGLGAVMPFAGKLVAVGISGMGVDGTLTADAYIDGVANTSYQISLTGSATNVKNYVTYTTPLSFVAGTSINWQVSAVPTAGTGFVITFFVVFN